MADPFQFTMTSLIKLYCMRSDGALRTAGPDGQLEDNCPTPEQMERTEVKPGKIQYYKQLCLDDEKYRDWLMKLAGMVMKEIGNKSEKALASRIQYVLNDFPEHYRLYEHIKTSIDATGSSSGGKSHAGGGNDRQDAYLYGHPQGRRKRYRSPSEFLPHLLFLLTNDTFDHEECCCRICAPDEFQHTMKQSSAIKDMTHTGRLSAASASAPTTTAGASIIPTVSKQSTAPPAIPSTAPSTAPPTAPSTAPSAGRSAGPPAGPPPGPPAGPSVGQRPDTATNRVYAPSLYSAVPQVAYTTPQQQFATGYGSIYQQPNPFSALPQYSQQMQYPDPSAMGYHQQQPQSIQLNQVYQQPQGSQQHSSQEDAYPGHETPDVPGAYDMNGFNAGGLWRQT